jgi:benzil reductase ((S)-benzoin forming)
MPIVIITGASKGIGIALTRELASRGLKVIAIARGEGDLKRLQNEFPEKIHFVSADVSTEEGRSDIVKAAAFYGKIDYLVNNAAIITPITNLENVREEEITKILNTNVVAPIMLTTQLRPLLTNGRVLNISSAAEFLPTSGIGLYNISKAALSMATHIQQMELEQYKIAVNSVIPGEVETNMQEELRATGHPIAKQFQESYQKDVLMPPSTCASFLAWLLLETASDVFVAQKWTIYDKKHWEFWLKENMKLPLPIIEGQTSIAVTDNKSNLLKPLEKDSFTLEKFFSYLELADFKPSPLSLQDLTKIIEHYLLKFHYQNTELYEAGKIPISNRKVPSLDINTLFERMIIKKGGYCFQHLELLYAVLDGVGFSVDRHLAKTILQNCSQLNLSKQEDAKTHELLIIHLNDSHYIVDVGLANQSLRAPLELKEGIHAIDDDQYCLTKIDDLWILDTKTKANPEWFRLYQFFNKPVKYNDIEEAHQNLLLTEEHIRIRDDKLLIGKTTLEKRKYLTWSIDLGLGMFKSIKKGAVDPKTEKFTDFDKAYECVKNKFF